MDFRDFVNGLVGVIVDLLPLLLSAALLVFGWGVAKFIFRVGGGGEKEVSEGRELIKWGLVALFLLVTFGSIIYFFQNDLGFTEFGFPFLPI